MNVNLHLWLIPLLPFAGFLFNGILGRRLPKAVVTTVALLAPLASLAIVLNAAFASTSGALLPVTETCPRSWIDAGSLHVNFSFVLDQLSLGLALRRAAEWIPRGAAQEFQFRQQPERL